MYTHAREFPHLRGKSDAEIVAIFRRGLDKHPKYRKLMRARNVIVIFLLAPIGVAGLILLGGFTLGYALIAVGLALTLFVLVWNVVWVNTVVFKLTEEERKAGDEAPLHT
jgi:hypothetical protein